jgi:hypothetical protein
MAGSAAITIANGLESAAAATLQAGHSQQAAWQGEERWRLVDIPCCCCCSSPGTVVALQLPSNNLSGNFSALTELSNSSLASTLLYINVAGNPQLAGSIGHGVGTFKQLQGLSASSCRLSGQLPDSLADLSSLATLELSGNTLAGTLPPGLLQAQRLRTLQLDSNQLSGSSPLQELMLTPALQRFSIRGNRLTGPLRLPNASLLQPLHPDGDTNTAVAAITAKWHASLDDLDLGKNLVSTTCLQAVEDVHDSCCTGSGVVWCTTGVTTTVASCCFGITLSRLTNTTCTPCGLPAAAAHWQHSP